MAARLTKRIADHVCYSKGKYEDTIPAECETSDVRAILNRLAAYEDTGYSPENFDCLCREMSRIRLFVGVKTYELLRKLVDTDRDGRCVAMPDPEEYDYNGLKVKYRVYKAKDNSPVENCFVLRPDVDPAAVAALTAYAKATDNKQLSEDILNWITPDERVHVLMHQRGDRIYIIDNKVRGSIRATKLESYLIYAEKPPRVYIKCTANSSFHNLENCFATSEAAKVALES